MSKLLFLVVALVFTNALAQNPITLGTIQSSFEMNERFTGDPNYPRTKNYEEIQQHAYIAAYNTAKSIYDGNVDVHSFNIHIQKSEKNKTEFIMMATVVRLPEGQHPKIFHYSRPINKGETVIAPITKILKTRGQVKGTKMLLYFNEELNNLAYNELLYEALATHGEGVEIRNISIEVLNEEEISVTASVVK